MSVSEPEGTPHGTSTLGTGDALNACSVRPHKVNTMLAGPDPGLAGLPFVAAVRWHVPRVIGFGFVSGVGLLLDLILFLVLVRAGVAPFVANILSSGSALTFVYCASVRRVFRYDGHFIVPLFAVYVAYHVCGTLLVSWVISRLIHQGAGPALAKVAILPLTFLANYAFMTWLTASRERWARRAQGPNG